MERPDLAKLKAQKSAAMSFHVRALKDRLRIEAAFLKLQQEIRALRNGGDAPNDHGPNNHTPGDRAPPD
jgi:hypothetical protein